MIRRINPLTALIASPIVRRVAWHTRRIAGAVDRRFFLSLAEGAAIFVGIAALLVTLVEKPWYDGVGPAIEWFGKSFNWAIFTILGQGDSGYVTSLGGFIVSWLLVLFGVAIVGTITGALVALVIDFLLKEGQGLGASGYKDHIVVCGWNATARDLIEAPGPLRAVSGPDRPGVGHRLGRRGLRAVSRGTAELLPWPDHRRGQRPAAE